MFRQMGNRKMVPPSHLYVGFHLKCCSLLGFCNILQQKHWNAALGIVRWSSSVSHLQLPWHWAYQQWWSHLCRCSGARHPVWKVWTLVSSKLFFRISGLIWSCQISETWVLFVLFNFVFLVAMATSDNSTRLRAAECDFIMCWSQLEPISHHIPVVEV